MSFLNHLRAPLLAASFVLASSFGLASLASAQPASAPEAAAPAASEAVVDAAAAPTWPGRSCGIGRNCSTLTVSCRHRRASYSLIC